ncbi:MAG TPA: cytochrome c maturation protein CcmE, partial [Sphingomicrobium sp.]
MKPKNQRLVLVGAALAAVLVAVLLAMWGLRERASYFYTPAEIASVAADPGKAVRLGGMVEKGSVRRAADGITIGFVVTDGAARVWVTYRGIVPDLFREGSGVVVEGEVLPPVLLHGGAAIPSFRATTILAKHDERYMPP